MSLPSPTVPGAPNRDSLPPLDRLRFFEAAAGHRIRTLERHLDAELFERRRRSVHLNRRGRAYRCLETEVNCPVPASRKRMTQAIAGCHFALMTWPSSMERVTNQVLSSRLISGLALFYGAM